MTIIEDETKLMNNDLIEAAWQGYIQLLRMPITIRLKYQSQLCMLRDNIAKSINETPEAVQTTAELVVIKVGGLI